MRRFDFLGLEVDSVSEETAWGTAGGGVGAEGEVGRKWGGGQAIGLRVGFEQGIQVLLVKFVATGRQGSGCFPEIPLERC